jgi:hypothetical protein
MSQYRFITALDENWLFRSKRMQDFTARDVADLAFLYMVSLHILRCEFDTAPFAVRYARQTSAHSNFRAVDKNNTDLYQFLNILSDPSGQIADQLGHPEANAIFWHDMHFNPTLARQFLSNITAETYSHSQQKRILFQLESQLHITVSNYRSMRRIAVDWVSTDITSEAQKLVVTRMLQALRAKARRGDLLPQLEKLSTYRKYELFNVCDQETGKGCDGDVAEPAKPSMGMLKALALGAAAGGALVHMLGKRK